MTEIPSWPEAVANLSGLALTDDERGYLAMHAHYAAERECDPRYFRRHDPVERERLRQRWQEIADALHPDPFGAGPHD